MERLRRSFRESFRRKKDKDSENSKPHQWQTDEANVRGGTCSFHVKTCKQIYDSFNNFLMQGHVPFRELNLGIELDNIVVLTTKYLGCVEVFESRGMQVCEEALKVLRSSRRRPLKGTLYVSGDGLRVVDDDSKGLIVDQTIEKVSFCAPDRYHERGFSYICRDGTTRRWMCHGFLATKDSGERLSHAVGCAFAVCLERKQKRERDPGVPIISNDIGNFKRAASLRSPPPVSERIDPQENKHSEPPPVSKIVVNPHAIARPHAAPHLLARQGSIRGVPLPTQMSPFKRQMSLRVNELPSTVERQLRSMSLDAPEFKSPLSGPASPESQAPPPRVARDRQPSLPGSAMQMTPIFEHSPGDKSEGVPELCQQFSHGHQQLTNNNVPSRVMTNQNQAFHVSPPSISPLAIPARQPAAVSPPIAPRAPSRGEEWLGNIVSQRVASPPMTRSSPLKSPEKADPFNADWAVKNQNGVNPNNPFLTTDTKVTRTFQVQL